MQSSYEQRQQNFDESKQIDKGQFKKFAPMVRDLRKESKVALFSNTFIMIRRVVLLLMAMFIVKQPWLQVLVFMSLSLSSLVFLIVAKPYKDG